MKKADRRHADPLVSLALILENILNELRDSPDVTMKLLVPKDSFLIFCNIFLGSAICLTSQF